MTERPQRALVAGARGCIGRAFLAYMKREHPEVGITQLLPFPFSLQALAGALQGSSYSHFVNAAALGDDSASVTDPYAYFDTNVTGVLNQLEMVRKHSPATRFVNLGTIFENDPERRSPYTASKRMARELVKSYRENHGIYAVTATLGFTEYFGRPETTLARKVTKGVARIAWAVKRGEPFEPLTLRDIDQEFTWTWAEDVAEGVWAMLNQEECPRLQGTEGTIIPAHFDNEWEKRNGAKRANGNAQLWWPHIHDYALVGSEAYTLREFVTAAFETAGVNALWIDWDGHPDATALHYDTPDQNDSQGGKCLVSISGESSNSDSIYIPTDSSLAYQDLGWTPRFSLSDIAREMVAYDLAELEKGGGA